MWGFSLLKVIHLHINMAYVKITLWSGLPLGRNNLTHQNTMKNISDSMTELGKAGAAKRWEGRYETIVELTKFYGKDHQEEFLRWPTKYLVQLLKWQKGLRQNKKS